MAGLAPAPLRREQMAVPAAGTGWESKRWWRCPALGFSPPEARRVQVQLRLHIWWSTRPVGKRNVPFPWLGVREVLWGGRAPVALPELCEKGFWRFSCRSCAVQLYGCIPLCQMFNVALESKLTGRAAAIPPRSVQRVRHPPQAFQR